MQMWGLEGQLLWAGVSGPCGDSRKGPQLASALLPPLLGPPVPLQFQRSAGALSKPYLLPPGLGVWVRSAGPVTVPTTSIL